MGSGAGIDGLEERGDGDMTVAAEVSLAVAAKAAAENFPVALRILPRRYRAHLTALYGFARLVDDIGDEPLPGLPADASPETITATRLKLLDDLGQDVAKIYNGQGEPELDRAKPHADASVRQLIKFEADRAEQLLDEGAPLIGTLRGAARIAIAGYLAGGRAALKAIADQNYDVLTGAPKPGKADTLVAMARCYLKGR